MNRILMLLSLLAPVIMWGEHIETAEMKDASKSLSEILTQFSRGEIDHIVLGSKFADIRNGIQSVEDRKLFILKASKEGADKLKTDLSDSYLKNLNGRATIAFYSLTSFDAENNVSDKENAEEQLKLVKLYEPLLREIQKLIIKNYNPGPIVHDSTINLGENKTESTAPSESLIERKQQNSLRNLESLLVPIYKEKAVFIEKTLDKKGATLQFDFIDKKS